MTRPPDGTGAPFVLAPDGDPASLRALLDSLGAGVYAVDAAGLLRALNPEAERLLGLHTAAVLGRRAHDLLHARRPDGQPYPEDQCALLAVLRTGERAERDDDVFVRGDGDMLPVSWVSSPIVADGQISGAVVVFRSVAQEQKLRAEREAALAAEQAERARVQAANSRLELLSDTTQALTSTLDLTESLARLARLVVPRLADWCVVDVRHDDGTLLRSALAHRDPGKLPPEAVPLVLPDPTGSTAPLAVAMRDGETQVVRPSDVEAAREQDPLRAAQFDLFRRLGLRQALVVPLVARRRVIGALTVVRAEGEPLASDDVRLVEDIARRAALAVDNARLHGAQRDVAETLQRSLLTMLPTVDHITIAARYLPAGAHSRVGGDWYDSFLLPDGATALVIGDIAGHDLEAAARMGQVRNMLRALAVDRDAPPSDVLRRLDLAVDAFQAAGLATVVLGRVELPGDEVGPRQLRWSNAGHPPPLLVHPSGRTELLHGEPDLPLGVLPGAPRSDHLHELPQGCTLLLYTDGLVETRSSSVDEGLLRLRQAAARFAELPVQQFCDQVLQALEPAHDSPDDIAVIALRVPLPEHDGPAHDTPEQVRTAVRATGMPLLVAERPDRRPD